MPLRQLLFRIYWALERVIAPGLKYSHDLYEDVLESQVQGDTTWLDLGCGHQILPLWRAAQEERLVERCKSVVGIDADRPSVSKHRTIRLRVAGDIGRLPWRDGTFTLVTANMVVEHLDAPGMQFAEIARVLKPGGVFIVHTPNRRGYATIAARLIPTSAMTPALVPGRSPPNGPSPDAVVQRIRPLAGWTQKNGSFSP